MKITVRKIGGVWHGYLEGNPEVDERALTEEMARVKVQRVVVRLCASNEVNDGRESENGR